MHDMTDNSRKPLPVEQMTDAEMLQEIADLQAKTLRIRREVPPLLRQLILVVELAPKISLEKKSAVIRDVRDLLRLLQGKA